MACIDYDVVVAGGGTAGTAAAVAAARRGCRVLLVEEQNCLGGISTSGGVGEWFASLEGLGDIFAAVVRELENFGVRESRFFNPEYGKVVWQELALAAGVEVLFHASVVGAEVRDGRIESVRLSCCSRDIEVRAKMFVDATGEGDLGALAGAEFMQGDPQTGLTLHMTLTAWLYDTGRPMVPYLPAGLEPIADEADLPGLGAGWLVDRGRVFLNATKVVRHDPTDPFQLAAAEIEARRQLARIVHYAQRSRFPNHAIGGSGARIGIREGRRLVGDHVLRGGEVLDRNEPLDAPDGVAVATSQIDFHSLTKAGKAGWRQRVECYSIPFRCLVVKGFRNLLMAGKCISVDQVVHSSCRMTPTCCAMGQAAGTAAALAANLADIRDLPVGELRTVLAAEGMELDPAKHTPFALHETRLAAGE